MTTKKSSKKSTKSIKKNYVPIFDNSDFPDIAQLNIWMIPQIILTNIRIALRLGDEIDIDADPRIIGISTKKRVVNYNINNNTRKRNIEKKTAKHEKMSGIVNDPDDKINQEMIDEYNQTLEKRKRCKGKGKGKRKYTYNPNNKYNHVDHSFNIIIRVPESGNNYNIAVFSTGKFKVTGSDHNEKHSQMAVKIFCEIIMNQFPSVPLANGAKNPAHDPNCTWWYLDIDDIVSGYIKSKGNNDCLWKYTDLMAKDVEHEIRDNIIKFNNADKGDYNAKYTSLIGIVGQSSKSHKQYNPKCLVFGTFPALIRAQCSVNYEINCRKLHQILRDQQPPVSDKPVTNSDKIFDQFRIEYDPQNKTNLIVRYPVKKKNDPVIEINPTGMITFHAKTIDRLMRLYDISQNLFTKEKNNIIKMTQCEFGDSSDSDIDCRNLNTGGIIIRRK